MEPTTNSLVLYKNRPARVLTVGDKLDIELEGSKTQRVRPKDVTLLHPGPFNSLSELEVENLGEIEATWELLAGETTEIAELAELAFGDYTPATTWAAWEFVAEGLYFYGTPNEIQARSQKELEDERATRAAKAARARAWSAFLERLQAREVGPEDAEYLSEVEAFAEGRGSQSRVLRALDRPQTPESAHALLLELGWWDKTVNPHPSRLGLPTTAPRLELPELPNEARIDLTHLPAYAIDDAGNQDPDDALTLDGDRLWIHVADVAALVSPEDPLEEEARARAASLYLPEYTVPMLPLELTNRLGLGLNTISPALSFGVNLTEQGGVSEIEVVRSWVQVTRMNYTEVEDRLTEPPFRQIHELTQSFRGRRQAHGAVFIDLPEVSIQVDQEGNVDIQPLPKLASRELVAEAMLMAGEAVARFALEREIPIPFTTQPPPETFEQPETLAAMYAYRKQLKPSQRKSVAEPHAGLGLTAYTQATSPLRRYHDLLLHQQLRAYLTGAQPLTAQEVLVRAGAAEAVTGTVRRAQRLARRHWTLVYLLQQDPKWCGEAVLVDKRGKWGVVIIPSLALEASVPLRGDPPLDSHLSLCLKGIDLAKLEVTFAVTE